MSERSPRIVIAGIGGASLGTEIAKALRLAGGYDVLGCDISPLAFGHYDPHFTATKVIGRQNYVANVLGLCRDENVDCIIPGGDEPAVLLSAESGRFAAAGIAVCQNDPELVAVLSDKDACFRRLASLGVSVPTTRVVNDKSDLDGFPMPCVVKPTTGSGGSAFVFFARNGAEAELYCTYLRACGRTPLVQEYLSEEHGEFTVGVLSVPGRHCLGAIALKRSFHSKLSVLMRGEGFLISSGYSQGLIEGFPEICAQAMDISQKLGSVGPLNIQGRLTGDGRLIPFEINPRFSASTYLRALAGFNEVDVFIRHLLKRESRTLEIRPGWYLRSLAEVAVPLDKLVS